MSRTLLPHIHPESEGKPGWYHWANRIMVRCICGVTLPIDCHEVGSNGDVNPSLHHAAPEGCGWHEWATLEHWERYQPRGKQ